MSSERAICKVCGEPMPSGEEMFLYHGYSGSCPKPPLPKKSIDPKEERIAELEAKLAVADEALDKASSHLNALYYFAPAHDSDGLAIKSTEKLCNEALKKIRSGGTGDI